MSIFHPTCPVCRKDTTWDCECGARNLVGDVPGLDTAWMMSSMRHIARVLRALVDEVEKLKKGVDETRESVAEAKRILTRLEYK